MEQNNIKVKSKLEKELDEEFQKRYKETLVYQVSIVGKAWQNLIYEIKKSIIELWKKIN